MNMTQDEMLDKLVLTPEQYKLFRKFQKAYYACLDAKIEFIGFDDSVFALNGEKILGQSDGNTDYAYGEENVFEFNTHQKYFNAVEMNEHYASTDVRLKVSED